MPERTMIPIHRSWTQLLRWWAMRPWNPNPLLRASDRFEATVRIIAALAALLAVPVAGALGTSAYTESAAHVRAEQAAKHSVSAVLTEDSAKSPADEYRARVRWDDTGRFGTAVVTVRRGTQAGDQVTVWLGLDGVPTAAPPKTDAAVITGIGVGVGALVSVWLCGWCLMRSTGWLLDRHRNAGWAGEWRQFSQPRKDRK